MKTKRGKILKMEEKSMPGGEDRKIKSCRVRKWKKWAEK